MKNFVYSFILIASITLFINACQLKHPEVTQPVINKTVMQVLRDDARFTTLVRAIEKAGLVDAFNTPLNSNAAEGAVGDSITLLAPDNAAFTASGVNIDNIDAAPLAQVLLYHVPLVGRSLTTGIPATQLPSFVTINTNQFAHGQIPGFPVANNNFPFASTTRTEAFLRMRNTPSQTEVLPTPTALTGTVPTNNNNRIFIIGTRVNGVAAITTPNIVCSNGAIHIIDRVLVPTSNTLYDIISNNPNYSRFRRAVDRITTPNVRDILSTIANVRTVFVPTNDAFTAAGFPDDASIDNAAIATLTNIVRYHITNNTNRRFSNDIPNGFGLFTDLGSTINNQIFCYTLGVDLGFNTIFGINTRSVGLVGRTTRNTDQLAINGVLHEINGVLRPREAGTSPERTLTALLALTVPGLGTNLLGTDLFSRAIPASGLSLTAASVGTANAPLAPLLNAPAAATFFTIFAPTDNAMIAAGYTAAEITRIAAITDNANPEKTRLRNIIRYHILPGTTASLVLTNGFRNTLHWNGVPFLPATGAISTINSPTRVNWFQIVVSVSGGNLAVRGTADANFVQISSANRDVLGTDGIIHVIDRVLTF